MTSSGSRSQVLLGHKKLDTTPLYTRVAISAIGEVTSPLDLLLKMPAQRAAVVTANGCRWCSSCTKTAGSTPTSSPA